LKIANKLSGILKHRYFLTFYQPLRGALVDPKMLAARAGSTIAGSQIVHIVQPFSNG
jgi:hypothetical protein